MILQRALAKWNGPRRLRCLLDLGVAVYGLLTVSLVAAFVITALNPYAFVRGFSVLLFIIGSTLAADGVLGLRTRLDRSYGRLRVGTGALAFAIAKLLAGIAAILLLCVGLTL
jgi:hypothetical protein